MPDDIEGGASVNSRFTDFMRRTDITDLQNDLTNLLRLRKGGGMTEEASLDLDQRIRRLVTEIVSSTVAYYAPEAQLVEVGNDWVFNGADRGYGVKWGSETVQVRVKDRKYSGKDITKAAEQAARNPHTYQLPGKREVFIEGAELATALPMALELAVVSEESFHRITDGGDVLTARVITLDTFATMSDTKKTFQFTPGGIVEKV